jgi:hypothetical protein
MQPVDTAFFAAIAIVILYLLNDTGSGGKRGRMPIAVRA